jgi:hypothetical protein
MHFISAVGGALLAAWFAIMRLQFNEDFAWWVAICLAITPVEEMTPEAIPEIAKDAVAVFTDDPTVPLPAGW